MTRGRYFAKDSGPAAVRARLPVCGLVRDPRQSGQRCRKFPAIHASGRDSQRKELRVRFARPLEKFRDVVIRPILHQYLEMLADQLGTLPPKESLATVVNGKNFTV